MSENNYLRHRFIVATQSFLLVASIASILGLLGWLIGGIHFLVLAIVGVLVLYFVNPILSPVLVMKLYRGQKLSYYEASYLYDILNTLSVRAELTQSPAIYILPGNAMSAFTTGIGKNAVMGISEGMLRYLETIELAAVMAHEISHIINNDVRTMGFAHIASHITNIFSMFGLLFLFLSLPLLILNGYTINWLFILILIFGPHISFLFQLALARTREYAADLKAAELMGEPESLILALAKMEHYQNQLYKRYFRVGYQQFPKFPGDSFMSTHPPTKKRIQRLLEISKTRQSFLIPPG